MKKNNLIPWGKPVLSEKDEKFVLKALNSSWISGGSYVSLLEKKCSDYLNCSYVSSVSNGTLAILVSYMALDLKKNDEIIIPSFGYMAAANVAINLGLKVVFCDVDKDTWCMSPETLNKKLSKNTKVIVAIHTYGNVCEMEEIMKIAKESTPSTRKKTITRTYPDQCMRLL